MTGLGRGMRAERRHQLSPSLISPPSLYLPLQCLGVLLTPHSLLLAAQVSPGRHAGHSVGGGRQRKLTFSCSRDPGRGRAVGMRAFLRQDCEPHSGRKTVVCWNRWRLFTLCLSAWPLGAERARLVAWWCPCTAYSWNFCSGEWPGAGREHTGVCASGCLRRELMAAWW